MTGPLPDFLDRRGSGTKPPEPIDPAVLRERERKRIVKEVRASMTRGSAVLARRLTDGKVHKRRALAAYFKAEGSTAPDPRAPDADWKVLEVFERFLLKEKLHTDRRTS